MDDADRAEEYQEVALAAAIAAALAIYDMCKSIDPDMAVERVQLEEKTGGIHGDYRRSAGP